MFQIHDELAVLRAVYQDPMLYERVRYFVTAPCLHDDHRMSIIVNLATALASAYGVTVFLEPGDILALTFPDTNGHIRISRFSPNYDDPNMWLIRCVGHGHVSLYHGLTEGMQHAMAGYSEKLGDRAEKKDNTLLN